MSSENIKGRDRFEALRNLLGPGPTTDHIISGFSRLDAMCATESPPGPDGTGEADEPGLLAHPLE